MYAVCSMGDLTDMKILINKTIKQETHSSWITHTCTIVNIKRFKTHTCTHTLNA